METPQIRSIGTSAEWDRACREGFDLMADYIEHHAFIHDDHWTHESEDFDELSGHPTLLDVQLAVTSRLPSSGQGHADANVIVTPGRSPLETIASQPALQSQVAREIARRKLDLSLFYSNRPEAQELVRATSLLGHVPAIRPDPSTFTRHSHHAQNWEILRELSPSFPSTAQFYSARDAHRAVRSASFPTYVKGLDSTTIRASNQQELANLITDCSFPIIMQSEVANALSSPVFQWIRWKDQVRPLFISSQLTTREYHHRGNLYTRQYEGRIARLFHDDLMKAMHLLPDWEGPLALDYIETESALVPVDLNARFNSSTIPLYAALIRRDYLGPHIAVRYSRRDRPNPHRDADKTLTFGQSLYGTDQVHFTLRITAPGEAIPLSVHG